MDSVSEPVPRLVFQERMHLETECLGLGVTGWEDTTTTYLTEWAVLHHWARKLWSDRKTLVEQFITPAWVGTSHPLTWRWKQFQFLERILSEISTTDEETRKFHVAKWLHSLVCVQQNPRLSLITRLQKCTDALRSMYVTQNDRQK